MSAAMFWIVAVLVVGSTMALIVEVMKRRPAARMAIIIGIVVLGAAVIWVNA